LDKAKKTLENLLNPTGSALAAAELAVVTALESLDDAQNAVDALNYPRANEGTIASAQANYLLALDKVDKMQGIYDHTEGDPNADTGKALALSNLQNAKNDASRSLATLNWYLGEPTEDEVATKNIELHLAQSQLTDAQEALEALKNPGDEDIVLAQAAVDEAEEALETARNGATESELILAQVRLTTAEAALAQAVLTAPFAGTITEIDVRPGDIVSGGRSAFRIDDLSKLYIDLQVSEVDVLQVKTGQEAEIVFDAIDGKTYTGKVTKIGMVASGSQGVVNYPVTVQLLDPDESILPGMTASVTIVVEVHEDVMVVPSSAVRTGVGQRTVTVMFEGEQISVPVTTGLTSDSMTEVSSEQLREGDSVVLNGTTGTTTSSSQNIGMPGPMIIQGDFGERFEGVMP
ncbi:MAG: efflux RND transporter periplasmic adaptor subunit, partial [Chloroflexota bacterium]